MTSTCSDGDADAPAPSAIRIAFGIGVPGDNSLIAGTLDLARPTESLTGQWVPLSLDATEWRGLSLGSMTQYHLMTANFAMLLRAVREGRDAAVAGTLVSDHGVTLHTAFYSATPVPTDARLLLWHGGLGSGDPYQSYQIASQPWPEEVHVEGTSHGPLSGWHGTRRYRGIVYTVSVSVPHLHTGWVGEAHSRIAAEAKAYARYQVVMNCEHAYAYADARRDGWGYCIRCRITGMFLPPLDHCAVCEIPARYGRDREGRVYCEVHYQALPDDRLTPEAAEIRAHVRELFAEDASA